MSDILITPPYFVELLNEHQQVISRQRFEALPIKIGRSYHNDFIVEDPYVSPEHAMIEMTESGAIQMRDLGSENGIIHYKKRENAFTLDDQIVLLGRSHVRVRHAGFQVANTLLSHQKTAWGGLSLAILGVAMIILSVFGSTWLATSEKFSTISALTAIALTLGAVLIWSGVWGFVSRIMRGHAHLGKHILIVACAIWLIDAWKLISATFAYAFSLSFLTQYASHIVLYIFVGMVFFHLLTLKGKTTQGMILTSLALAFVGSSFIFISNDERNGTFADNLYMPYLLNPAFRLSGDHSIDTFFEEANSLKAKLEEARKAPVESSKVFGF
jgi:hypothetical protein